MAEYLDKEAFKKCEEERYCKPCKADGKDYNGCRCRACWVDDMLDEVECFQPAADVAQVVRCKDCRKFKTYACRMAASGYDDFCSYGERKDDKNEH